MKAPCRTTARMTAVLAAVTLLSQCSMPPEQAWRYIQTNGLLSYMQGPRQPSPPFRAGTSGYQGYALNPQRRYTPAVAWNAPLPSRSRYSASTTPNSYLSQPSASERYVPRSRPSTPAPETPAKVKIPVQEPAHAPQVTSSNPVPQQPAAPKTNSSAPEALSTENLPYGSPVPGRTNMVNSPYAGKTQLVDVSGMSAGQTVKCPYTGKLFKVPPTQQAAAQTESSLEAKSGEKKP